MRNETLLFLRKLLGPAALDVTKVKIALGIECDAVDPVELARFSKGDSCFFQRYPQENLAL